MMRRGAAVTSGLMAVMLSCPALAQTTEPSSGKRTIGAVLGALTGAPAPQIDPATLQALLADLESEDFATREAATVTLATNESISSEQLEALAGSGGLPPEPQARVLEALRRRFVATARPALGITMEQGGQNGVLISNVDQRFPAFQVLQRNDVVLSIGGESLQNALSGADMLRLVVMSFLPNEEIPLTLQRGEEVVNVLAPLGRFEDLNQNLLFTADALAPSWDIRTRRRGLVPAMERAIEVSVPGGSWRPQRRGAYDPGSGGGLIAGGQAAAVKDEPIVLQSSNGRWRDVPVRERAGFRAAENANNAVVAVPAPPIDIGLRDLLIRRVEAMRQQVQAEAEALSDPRLSAEQRAALRERVIRQSRELQSLQEQIERLPPGE